MELAREGAGTGAYLYGAPGTNAGMNPFGLQVALSNHMPAGNFLIGSLRSSAMVYNREGAVIEAGFVNADFTLNLVTLRAEERLGLGCERPAGIYYGDFSL
jgi:HK97 family phage major capsid protein